MFFLRALLYLIALPALAVVLLGYFGSVHASLNSFSHFRLHFAALAAVCGIILVLIRRKAVGLLVTFSALIPLVFHMDQLGGKSPGEVVVLIREMLPEQVSSKSARLPGKSEAPAPRYRLLHANLHYDTPDPKEFLRLVGEFKPDVMTLNEVSDIWRPAIETLKAAYPQQLVCPAVSELGAVAILSNRPFAGDALNGCANDGELAFQRVDFGGRQAMIGTAHLFWPWPHGQSQQITQMRGRMKSVGDAGGAIVFAGDLNAAPWSHSANRISAFLNADSVTVPGGSWLYETLPMDYARWGGLPIDNVFARSIFVTNAERGQPFGSDHLPSLIEFSIEDAPDNPKQSALAN